MSGLDSGARRPRGRHASPGAREAQLRRAAASARRAAALPTPGPTGQDRRPGGSARRRPLRLTAATFAGANARPGAGLERGDRRDVVSPLRATWCPGRHDYPARARIPAAGRPRRALGRHATRRSQGFPRPEQVGAVDDPDHGGSGCFAGDDQPGVPLRCTRGRIGPSTAPPPRADFCACGSAKNEAALAYEPGTNARYRKERSAWRTWLTSAGRSATRPTCLDICGDLGRVVPRCRSPALAVTLRQSGRGVCADRR